MTRAATLALLLVAAAARSSQADIVEWTGATLPGVSSPIRALAIDPVTPTTMYAGASNGAIAFDPLAQVAVQADGIFKSIDGGVTWTPANTGLTNKRVVAIVIDPQAPATLYAGVDGGGIFKSVDAAGTWTAHNSGLPAELEVYALAIDPQNPSALYAGMEHDGVFKSADGADTWSSSSTGLATEGQREIWGLAVDPQTPTTLYAATLEGVQKSVNGGASWTPTAPTSWYNYLSGTIEPDQFKYSLAIDPTSPSTVYVGTIDAGGVFKTTNGGASWSEANKGLEYIAGYNYVTSLAIDPQNPATLYAGTQNAGIFRSTNGGALWVPQNAGLSSFSAWAITFTPGGGPVFAGTELGAVQQPETVPLALDHFRCFKARGDPPGVPATLVDDLETRSVTVKAPVSFCEPVDVAGQGMVDPTAHLTCYRIAPTGGYMGASRVSLANQIADPLMFKLKPATLCVPTERVGMPSALALNRFKTYETRRVSTTPYALSVEGALGSQTAKFYAYASAAVPVDKDGAGILDPSAHLSCFRLLTRSPRYGYTIPPLAFTPQEVTVQNEFGTQTLQLIKAETLCLASLRIAIFP